MTDANGPIDVPVLISRIHVIRKLGLCYACYFLCHAGANIQGNLTWYGKKNLLNASRPSRFVPVFDPGFQKIREVVHFGDKWRATMTDA